MCWAAGGEAQHQVERAGATWVVEYPRSCWWSPWGCSESSRLCRTPLWNKREFSFPDKHISVVEKNHWTWAACRNKFSTQVSSSSDAMLTKQLFCNVTSHIAAPQGGKMLGHCFYSETIPFPQKETCLSYSLAPGVNLNEPLFLTTKSLTKTPHLFNSSFVIYPTPVSSFRLPQITVLQTTTFQLLSNIQTCTALNMGFSCSNSSKII